MRKLVILLFAILFLVSTAYSQSSSKRFKKPIVMIETYGGYNFPMHDLSGSEIGEFYNFQSYGVTNGFSTGFTVKFSVATLDKSQFRVYTNIGYSQFTRSQNNAYTNAGWITPTYPSWPIGDTLPHNKTSGSSFARINIPYGAVGFEYAIFVDPLLKSHFNFGLEINMSAIFGRYYNDTINTSDPIEPYRSIKENFRFGFALNAAYNYRLAEMFGMTFGLRYTLNNLIGRTTKISDDSSIYLNDDENPSINPKLTSSRIIGSLSIYAGVNFYIGSRK
ncbi:MAG: hypothetical protein LDL38_00245 [Flavobacterium piscis]|nr:hypothetical protein [Flavobacterium piscis]